eukprot:4983957-Alexandrium_andersonii.AAC.1
MQDEWATTYTGFQTKWPGRPERADPGRAQRKMKGAHAAATIKFTRPPLNYVVAPLLCGNQAFEVGGRVPLRCGRVRCAFRLGGRSLGHLGHVCAAWGNFR